MLAAKVKAEARKGPEHGLHTRPSTAPKSTDPHRLWPCKRLAMC